MTRNPLVVHQSDPGCLALLRARADGVDDASEPAKIGTATHAAAEDLTYACTLGEHFEPMDVVTRAVERVAVETDMAPASVSEALAIMEKLLAKDDELRFFSSGNATCHPEWQWALDEHFAPVDPSDTDNVAYAGTVDHLRVYEDGRLVVIDYKSIQKMPGGWELYSDWQARMYSLGVLANFPNVRSVTFRLVLLRHAYWIEETFTRGEDWEASTRSRMRYERAQRLEAHRTGAWPERMGVDCKWCPILHRCPALSDAADQGKVSELQIGEVARRSIGLKALATSLDKEARTHVARQGPIPLGDGSVLGDKPVQKWTLAHGEGKTVELLRTLGMSFDQETAWFTDGVTAAKAKDAMRKLLGKDFKAFLDDGTTVIVEPYTKLQHSVWYPDGKPKKGNPVVDALAEATSGDPITLSKAIEVAAREPAPATDPESVLRAALSSHPKQETDR